MYTRRPKWSPPPPSNDALKPFIPDVNAVSMLDGKPYVSEAHSDVQATWRRFGWKPLAERLAEPQ